MRKLIMTCLLTTVFLNAVNTHVSSAHATPTDSLAVELDNYLREQTTKGFSGQVLVVHKGQVILDKTYGLPAQSDPHIAFWLASNSKAFTATAILKLQEQGKLSVHDPITRFFKKVPIDKQKITVHQLLTHTSGLPQSYAADGISNRDEAVRAILKLPLETPVGESWTYSNDGYNLLAAIVKVASKKKFEDYLRTNILRPAGLKDTGFWGYQGKHSLASPANPTQVQKLETNDIS